MKKIKNILLCGVLAVSAAVIMSGCGSSSGNTVITEEYNGYLWNGGKRSLNISDMNGEERKTLVKNYLEYIGVDYGKYELGDVRQASSGNFSAESAYHCSVYIVNGDSFTVWLENDGKVIDDRFLDELNPLIDEYITGVITADYPGAAVDTSAGMHRKPVKEWKTEDGAENFLKSDEDYIAYICVVLKPDSDISQEKAEENMKNKLGFLNRADFCFFRKEKPEDVNFDDLKWSDADIVFSQSRDK